LSYRAANLVWGFFHLIVCSLALQASARLQSQGSPFRIVCEQILIEVIIVIPAVLHTHVGGATESATYVSWIQGLPED
jgi:hypothetical protein